MGKSKTKQAGQNTSAGAGKGAAAGQSVSGNNAQGTGGAGGRQNGSHGAGGSQNKMAVMPMNTLLLSMSVPLMLSLLVQSLYNIVDSMFVSRYSEQALTATSLVYAVQFLMIAVGVGTNVGLNSLLSRYVGAKKEEDACRAATTGLILNIASALIFSLVGIFFSKPIAGLMTSDPELKELCIQYMQVCVIFCYGTFIQTYGQRLLQAVGDTILSMVSLISGAIINIILDPIMIFGLLGCPEMGIRGAAIATVIGQCTGAVVALVLNKTKNPVIHVHFKGYHFNMDDVKAIYRVGMPTIVMQAIGSVMTFAVNAVLMSVSTTAVAFFGVYYKLQNFLMMPMNGLGQATIPIVGFNLGSGNKDRIKQAWKCVVPAGIVMALIGTVIFLAFPKQLLGLFAASEEMLAIGVPALRIISVTFVFATMTIIFGYFASGLGNGVINMIGGAIRQLVVLVPLVWVFTNFLGISYTWYAMWISEVLAFIYSFISIRKETKKKAGF
ncbi:MAG: MATE family efflux transporter [Lachnospiraceae bacterium]|nr:MATE family efflux transporter [Lachnospiraceae bacterium]